MSSEKFVIITTQRSGSSWLVSLLKSHPDIKMFSELFIILPKPKRVWSDKRISPFYEFREDRPGTKRPFLVFEYLNNLKSSFSSQKSLGFKLMYDQIEMAPEILLKLILDRYKFIHLVRENYLDVELSSVNAWSKEGNRIVHSKTPIKSLQPVNLEAYSLVERLLLRESKTKYFKKLLRILPRPVLTVTYKALCDSTDSTLSSITDFLGLAESSISYQSKLKKISRGSYKDKIANYSEVRDALLGTKFESFLDE